MGPGKATKDNKDKKDVAEEVRRIFWDMVCPTLSNEISAFEGAGAYRFFFAFWHNL